MVTSESTGYTSCCSAGRLSCVASPLTAIGLHFSRRPTATRGKLSPPTACATGKFSSGSNSSVAARAAPRAPTGSIAILGLVDLQGAAFELLAVQRLHCPGCIRIRHFDEAKTARTPRVTIGDQRHLLDRSMCREQSAHAIFSGGKREISHVEFGHCTLPADF
jgi:hypothetical protein